jgi:tetratricopeptide (TPR) repeat protein
MTVILALGPAPARAEQTAAEHWLGKRVVQRNNNFPLRLDGQAVLRSGLEIHIYRVERIDGDQLWLSGEDEGPCGWGSADQFVRVDDALAYLADRIRYNPEDVFFYALRATIHDDKKELARAVDDWNRIVELEPDNPASYFGRAKLWIGHMAWDSAIDDLTEAIKIDPNDAYCYRVRAHAWLAKREYERVIGDCDQSIRLDPKNATGFVTRAQAWLGKKAYDRAIGDATAAVQLDASNPLGYLYRGVAWSRKKDYDKAIADYNEAIRLDPDDAESYYNRAWAWQQKGNNARALDDYAAGVELDPELEWPRAEQGPAAAISADQKKTVDDFLRTLVLEHASADVTPGDPKPKEKQGGVVPASFNPIPAPQPAGQSATADSLGRNASSRAEAPAPLSRNSFGIVEPQSAREFASRAGDWLRVKMYDKAIADCDEAIDLGCRDPLARIYRGLAWREKKEYDKAIADYSEVIRLDPQNAFAYFARASAWTEKQEYAKADADLAAALRLDPQNPVTCNGRAWTWATCPDAKFRNGQKAVEAATKACELTDWSEAGIIDTLAAAYAEIGEFAQALKWQTRAIELETDTKNKEEFVARFKLYQAKKPYRATTP